MGHCVAAPSAPPQLDPSVQKCTNDGLPGTVSRLRLQAPSDFFRNPTALTLCNSFITQQVGKAARRDAGGLRQCGRQRALANAVEVI
jgi:hypothetical protein